jgi:hypothetical protein
MIRLKAERIILFFMVTTCFFSCVEHIKDTLPVIHEGQGLDKIIFGEINRNLLEHNFSIPYDSVVYGNYSIAIHYPRMGTYFYYLQNDDSARIFAMSFDTTFKGRTSKGFDIHRMTVEDMMRIYGKPRWQMLESAHMLYAHYDSSGIYFAILPNNIPEPDFYPDHVTEDDFSDDSLAERKRQNYYDSIYAQSRITEITIGVPGTSF